MSQNDIGKKSSRELGRSKFTQRKKADLLWMSGLLLQALRHTEVTPYAASSNNSEVSGIFIPTFQMEVLWPREVKSAVQGHGAKCLIGGYKGQWLGFAPHLPGSFPEA